MRDLPNAEYYANSPPPLASLLNHMWIYIIISDILFFKKEHAEKPTERHVLQGLSHYVRDFQSSCPQRSFSPTRLLIMEPLSMAKDSGGTP